MTQPRAALFFYQSAANATLSYQHGWPRAFAESHLLYCEPFNLANRSISDVANMMTALYRGRFDAIVLLHSVFSNTQELRRMLFMVVAASRLPKLFFIGNEYKSMPEKMRFCRRLGIDMLISQSNHPDVLDMYEQALGCRVASVPNTGFDPDVFFPAVPMAARCIDVGYRAYEAPWYLGNNEKAEIADYFLHNASALGLTTDISLDVTDRFDSSGYAAFLNRCRGQIGTETGGDYFELTGETRSKFMTYMSIHPDASWDEVKKRFFEDYGPSVPMRIISGRQVEAAACKTVQIMFDGRYNGYFGADEHFIALEKDYSNIDEVMQKFRDDDYCRRVVDSAYEVAMQELTYPALMKKFVTVMQEVL
jgi:hypothetical protein